jgi:cysteine synthase
MRGRRILTLSTVEGITPSTRYPSVGHTPLFSLPELSEYFGIRHLWIKDENANLFGTHKDRKSLSVVRKSINLAPHLRPQALCILTAGSAGLSLAGIGRTLFPDLPVIAFISQESNFTVLEPRLESVCERVVRLDLESHQWNSKELRAFAGAGSGRRVWDVTNGVIDPYSAIVDELCLLKPCDRPDIIVLPVGCGELFLGVERGLNRNRLKSRLVGVTIAEPSLADKLYARWRPHGNHVAQLTCHGSPHQLLSLNDEELLLDTFTWLKTHNFVVCEPSSAAAFAALFKIKSELKPDDQVVVINTGTFSVD